MSEVSLGMGGDVSAAGAGDGNELIIRWDEKLPII